jgi:hypothetical protein
MDVDGLHEPPVGLWDISQALAVPSLAADREANCFRKTDYVVLDNPGIATPDIYRATLREWPLVGAMLKDESAHDHVRKSSPRRVEQPVADRPFYEPTVEGDVRDGRMQPDFSAPRRDHPCIWGFVKGSNTRHFRDRASLDENLPQRTREELLDVRNVISLEARAPAHAAGSD